MVFCCGEIILNNLVIVYSNIKGTNKLQLTVLENIKAIQQQFPLPATIAYTFKQENNYWAILQQRGNATQQTAVSVALQIQHGTAAY